MSGAQTLDELAAGLSPQEVESVRIVIRACAADLLPDITLLIASGTPLEVAQEARRRLSAVGAP